MRQRYLLGRYIAASNTNRKQIDIKNDIYMQSTGSLRSIQSAQSEALGILRQSSNFKSELQALSENQQISLYSDMKKPIVMPFMVRRSSLI